MRRREFIKVIGGTTASWPLAARAQLPAKLPTIGFRGAATPSGWSNNVAAFVQRLRELGWIEGRTGLVGAARSMSPAKNLGLGHFLGILGAAVQGADFQDGTFAGSVNLPPPK